MAWINALGFQRNAEHSVISGTSERFHLRGAETTMAPQHRHPAGRRFPELNTASAHAPVTDAAQTTLCDHLVESGLDQPFGLLAIPSPAYLCPACLAVAVETNLSDGVPPADLVAAISFTLCEHMPGTACLPCRSAATAALSIRRWKAYFRDGSEGNRLQRVITGIAAEFDKATATTPKPVYRLHGRRRAVPGDYPVAALSNRTDIVVTPGGAR